jgi:hypothetical protein
MKRLVGLRAMWGSHTPESRAQLDAAAREEVRRWGRQIPNAISVNPVDQRIVYIGTSGGGVWKTLDIAGSLPVAATRIYSVKVDPNSSSVVLVGTDVGFFRSVDAGATYALMPGNVRELRNCVERALALARYSEITVDDLPDKIRGYRPQPPQEGEELLPLAEVERRHVVRVLEAARGNKKLAADILGLDRTTLYRKLERYALRDTVQGQ